MRKDFIRVYAEQRNVSWQHKARRVVSTRWVTYAVILGAGAMALMLSALL